MNKSIGGYIQSILDERDALEIENGRLNIAISVAMREGIDCDTLKWLMDEVETDADVVDLFCDHVAEYEPDLALCRVLRKEDK